MAHFIDPGTMPVHVQMRGRPETRSILPVAMHMNLSHLLERGLEFPRVEATQNFFGGIEERRAA